LSKVADARLGKTPARSHYTNEGVHRVVKFRDLSNHRLEFSGTKDAYVRNSPDSLRASLHRDFLADRERDHGNLKATLAQGNQESLVELRKVS